MKKTFYFMLMALFISIHATAQNLPNRFRLMESVLFYDGYAALVDEPTAPGIFRLRNDLIVTKIPTATLDAIGNNLDMRVKLKAACDNYDRIGNVNLAMVPIGTEIYEPGEVTRIEIARFITPFMNKNYPMDTVNYHFNIDNVAQLLKDESLRNAHDWWIELEIFGVPYAAQTQIGGCSNRNDTFFGTLDFYTNEPAAAQNENVLLPLAFKLPFNNYQANATDQLGQTVRTLSFEVEEALTDAALLLITSNHGANEGGEEYNRRNHFVYFDDEQVLMYKPGRLTCEPFRFLNTQPNGIYGNSPRTPAQWQSFSNWCPGDVIDTRYIALGALSAGTHTFRINVPDAVFVGQQGDIPLSLYLHGRTAGNVVSHTELNKAAIALSIYPNPASNFIRIDTEEEIDHVYISDISGRQVLDGRNSLIDVSTLPVGFYTMQIKLRKEGIVIRRQFIKE